MPAEAQMQKLCDLPNGQPLYYADETFTVPGFYTWNSEEREHIRLELKAVPLDPSEHSPVGGERPELEKAVLRAEAIADYEEDMRRPRSVAHLFEPNPQLEQGEKNCQCHHRPGERRCEGCPKARMTLRIGDGGDAAGMNDAIYAAEATQQPPSGSAPQAPEQEGGDDA